MDQFSNKYKYLLKSMILINFLGIYLNATLRYEYNYMFQTWNFKSFPKQTPKQTRVTVCFEMKSYLVVGNLFYLAQVTWVKVGQSKPFECIQEIVMVFAVLWTRIHFNQTFWTS